MGRGTKKGSREGSRMHVASKWKGTARKWRRRAGEGNQPKLRKPDALYANVSNPKQTWRRACLRN